jgi:hypothetical protein
MRPKLFLILIFTIFAVSGCGSAPETNSNIAANRPALPANSLINTANTANTANPANISNLAVNQAANTAQPQALSPIQIFRALGDAGNSRNPAALRQLFNRRSLEMFAGDAKAQGKPVDEVMANQRAVTVAKSLPQIRNEKITGDTATIEVRQGSGSWEKMYFTREDGQWKVAMDKYMEEMIRQVEESTKSLEKTGDKEGDK